MSSPAAPAPSSAAPKPVPSFSSSLPRSSFYSSLLPRVRRVLSSTSDPTASLANVSALLYHSLQAEYGPHAINWCGFYIERPIEYVEEKATEHAEDVQSTLVLGPFHGQPAVTVIPHSRGVCGQCAVERATQLVPDVHLHPNHIACDERSQSEIVIPVFKRLSTTAETVGLTVEGGSGGEGDEGGVGKDTGVGRALVAVLDLDCPVVGGFTEDDVAGLEAVSALLTQAVDWTHANHPVRMNKREDLTDSLDTCPSHV